MQNSYKNAFLKVKLYSENALNKQFLKNKYMQK